MLCEEVFPGEIQGLTVEKLGLKGPLKKETTADDSIYTVLLPLGGKSTVHVAGQLLDVTGNSLVRVPYNNAYTIEVKPGQEAYYLRFTKHLDDKDKKEIKKNAALHSRFYAPKFLDCPAYKEDIKSAKTTSRMLLPEGYVPRFCMGSVETIGPDLVAAHEHPMLEQLFFGLKNCRATFHADSSQAPLLENTLLHIPLGSKHSVSVEEGNILYYIWFDFFLTIEGQSYMSEQHHIMEEDKNSNL